MTRVTLVSGYWGQNIGNAFFNIGGKHLLEAAGNEVSFVQDSSAYWTFRNQSKGDYANAFDLLPFLSTDLLVLQGPVLTSHFPTIWKERLKRLQRAGIGWAIVSGAFRKYSAAELNAADDVFSEVAPEFVFTRDLQTAEGLRGRGYPAVPGVDSAFFVSDAFPARVRRSTAPPIVTFAFDHYAEPSLVADLDGDVPIGTSRYRLEFRELQERAARRGKAFSYLANPLDRRPKPSEIAGHVIVRPEHRTNPHVPWKIYRHPNAIASDEPWTYLSVYSLSRLTLSDRVHACVATLAYGNPAMLHNPSTKRSALFQTVGADEILTRVVAPDTQRINEAKANLVSSLVRLTQS